MSWITLVMSVVVAGAVSPVAGPEPARQAGPERLVSTAWLADHLNDPDLVLLHVGDPNRYPATHLSGARLVNLDDISVSEHSATGLMLQMPSTSELKARLEAFGISDGSRIVVYAADNYSSPSTRVMFTLDYAGLGGQASLLQGGLGAWTREGRPTTETVPPARVGRLSALKTEPIVVDAAFVKSRLHTPGVRIVDGRSKGFYDGVQTGGGRNDPMPPHKTGHITGAANVPFTGIFDTEGRVRPLEDLRALFDAAGVKAGDTVIGYCHIGQQATAMLFAAKLLGHDVRLFDGSFEEWSKLPDAPVTNPSGKEQ